MSYVKILRQGLALGALAFSAVITLWSRILDWAQSSLFPWIEKNLPQLIDSVKHAFSWFDDNVAVPTRLLIKKAWNALRRRLLKMAAYFERKSPNEWTRSITSWVIEVLDSAEPAVKKVEIIEEVSWDDLPPEVRKSWMKSNDSNHELDITEARDQQIAEMAN
jgi:hypothetical protein